MENEEVLKKEVRVVTNEDVKKYNRLITKWLRDGVVKNWNEANLRDTDSEVALGNTGWTMSDMRQQLNTELVVALQKYNPDYRTNEGRSVKESTFVYQHLYFRCGQLMKRLTNLKCGYGVWSSSLEATFKEGTNDHDM